MFDREVIAPSPPGPVPVERLREPMPGEPGYAAYLAYEDQQIAFWTAYAASSAPPSESLPNLNGARSDAGLLDEVGRAAREVNAAQGRKLRAIADTRTGGSPSR